MHKVINDGLVRAIGLGLVVRPPIESCHQPGWGAPGAWREGAHEQQRGCLG